MKIIFLDFDGVLNSDRYFSSTLFKKQYSEANPSSKIDPAKVKLINELVDKSGAIVVVSSAWRLDNSIDELTHILWNRGATFMVADVIPITPSDGCTILIYHPRGCYIQSYLDMICIEPESFVIIDDYDDMLHLKPFLVKTDSKIGIIEKDVQKALDILGE